MNKQDLLRSTFLFPIGLCLSILINLFSYEGLATLIFRSIVVGTMWSGLGFGVLVLTQKFLPEVYTSIENKPKENESTESQEIKGQHLDVSVTDDETVESINFGSDAKSDDLEGKFSIDTSDVDKGSSTSSYDTSESGKNKKYEFDQEPKVLAKAVRTVMKKE